MAEQNKLLSFYYTFGSSEHFPYQRGWAEVRAANREEADRIFRNHYPDRTEGIMNCAFVYNQAAFDQMQLEFPMASDWSVCHEVLTSQMERPDPRSEIAYEPFSTDFAGRIQDARSRAGVIPDTHSIKHDRDH